VLQKRIKSLNQLPPILSPKTLQKETSSLFSFDLDLIPENAEIRVIELIQNQFLQGLGLALAALKI